MATGVDPNPKLISWHEVELVLEQARAAGWEDLALVGPLGAPSPLSGIPAAHTFYLREPLGARITRLASLPQLRRVDLSHNQLRDGRVRALATLPALTGLYLRDNEIGSEGARGIAALTELTALDLADNHVADDGAIALAGLARLAVLQLQKNGIGDAGARQLATLVSLTSLHLGDNHLRHDGVSALAALANLTKLNLGGNAIGVQGALALPALVRLTRLDVSGSQLGAGGVRALALLPALTALALDGNQLGDEAILALTKLTTLTELRLGRNGLGPAGVAPLAALSGLTSLSLSENQLGDEGARPLTALTALTYLHVGGNRIGSEGARTLGELPRLASLDLRANDVGDDGARALAALPALTSLHLWGNQIGDDGACALTRLTRLSSLHLGGNHVGPRGGAALAALTELTSLHLWGNRVGNAGARALAALTELTSLYLWGNQIGDSGVRGLSSLTKLTALDLSRNEIGDVGACLLPALTRLTSLDLSENRIGDAGAIALTALTALISLDVSQNQIGEMGARALLDAWCDAPYMARRRIDLRGNSGISSLLPRELLGSQAQESLYTAYRRYREAARQDALRPLNEAKLVVVGNEAVGKTSLIRYLVHGTPRDPNEKKTPGAALHEKIEVSTWSVHQSQVRLNVWDFGGQEIMRGTHRFFLTERSLYLLVLEDRREDDRSIYEWLEIVAQRGGDSPVIVVVNKSDGDTPHLRLDEIALMRAYPVIAGFARTSCNADTTAAATIAELRNTIAATLSESDRLRHVRDPIPQSWLRVKDAVVDLARARSVLPIRDFERLCEGEPTTRETERITHADEQHTVLALLHDLGLVVAHGLRRDATAAWRETTVLDPNWLTGAIYALINSPTVRDQGGELRHGQLATLLDPVRYPTRWHELILSMMQDPDLGLCLPIAGGVSPTYLLPDALPVNEPDTGELPAGALRFRFQYNLLPIGFIPRFIVEAHRSLTDRPTWWRTGVVLAAEGCRILVRGDTPRNRVEIQVAGTTGQRAALSIVRNYFEAVHRYYARLPFKARVPLPEQPEVDVGYDHLIKLERDEGQDHRFLPEDADRKYSVRELLEGVRDDSGDQQRGMSGSRTRSVPEAFDDMTATLPGVRIPSRFRGKIDVGILTIREDENNAVLRRFAKVATEDGRRRYRIRSLALPAGGEYTLAVLRCVDQGNTDALNAARDLLEDLEPRFVLVVGIAGGVPSHEFSLGDVVVSSRIVDFSVEAVISGKDREYALGGGPLHPEAARLAGDLSAMVIDGELANWSSPAAIGYGRPPVDLSDDRFYGDAEWQNAVRQRIKRQFGGGAPRPPIAVTGAVASSDRLVKDDEVLAVWQKVARQVVAVEMESAGIYKATHGRVPFLAIRGISDVVGFKRDADWTAYACETAAAFAQAFLRTRPVAPLAPR